MLLLMLSVFGTIVAGASPPELDRICPGVTRVSAVVKQCQLNPYFVKAADMCLAKISLEIRTRTAALSLMMAGTNEAANQSQSGRLGNQATNLGNAKASLEKLREAASQVRDRLAEYRDNFIRAGGVNRSFARRLGPAFLGILESFPCYRDNHARISRTILEAERKIGEIDGALAQVGSLSGRTLASKELVGSGSDNLPVSSTNGVGTGTAAPRSTRGKKPSSITGVEEDAKKRGR